MIVRQMEEKPLKRKHVRRMIAVIALVILASLSAIASFSAPAIASTGSYVVVDTGQSKCYDNSKETPCPKPGEAFYGQDAQYSANKPAYRDNVDGTVTDINTGLMWVKSPGDKVTYAQAIAGAATCRVGGYTDWRLPTIKELYSLILFSGTDVSPCMNGGTCPNAVPFLDTNYFDFKYGDTSAGERIIDAQYWSSTGYVSSTMNGAATVFGVNFADGRIKDYPRDMGPHGTVNTQFVRYVRGNVDYGSNDFQDNADGTITDRATGLMWSQSDSGVGMNWQAALLWVQQKNAEKYLGYSDWRLPNAKELHSIVDYTRSPDTTSSAAINALFTCTKIINEAKQTDYPFYWTGTTHASPDGSGGAAAYLAFGRAMGYMNGAWLDVHGAGAQRSDPKSGNPADYPTGHGPQGDAIRIYNYVRAVRGGLEGGSTVTESTATSPVPEFEPEIASLAAMTITAIMLSFVYARSHPKLPP
jgi:hypothetical protein